MKKVIKRDGRLDQFNINKIKNVVLKAFTAVDGEVSNYAITKADNIAHYVEEQAKQRKKEHCTNPDVPEFLTVEEIQDMVEKGLMSLKQKNVAKAFMLYRQERAKERNRNNPVSRVISGKIFAKNIENQNANVDEMSFGGRKGEASNAYFKQYALDYCISDMARKNHESNEIYIHDLDSYAVGMHNCLSVPFDDLLAKGFNTRQTDVRPANSINTAFQLVAVIFQLQSLQQFGGVSATHLDWTMVPYVRKSFYKHFCDGMKYVEQIEFIGLERPITQVEITDEFYKEWNKAYQYAMDMTIKECQQAVEGMYHNLNTLQSRSGNQLKWMAG